MAVDDVQEIEALAELGIAAGAIDTLLPADAPQTSP